MRIELRFYEELNDFLAPGKRRRSFDHDCQAPVAIKDVIESLGVPHTEVELILADGESVGFAYRPAEGQRIAVYPKFESLDIGPLLKVRARPLRRNRFVLDGHLARLARWLRLLGFDCDHANHRDDAELARIAAEDERILLTRDRGLLMRREVVHGHLPRSSDPEVQLREVVTRFDLDGHAAPLTRCIRCNGLLHPVAKAEVLDTLPPATRREHDAFVRCGDCRQVYWPGSHLPGLQAVVDRAT